MTELELTRTPNDRRLYALDGVGTLRLKGMLSRSAIAEAGTSRWELMRVGLWQTVIQAVDPAGTVAGQFKGRTLKSGGTLRWAERELELRKSSFWHERYALAEGEHELATIEGKGWGKRPVKVTVDDVAAIDSGLLLFAAFVVRALAEDAASSSSGA